MKLSFILFTSLKIFNRHRVTTFWRLLSLLQCL